MELVCNLPGLMGGSFIGVGVTVVSRKLGHQSSSKDGNAEFFFWYVNPTYTKEISASQLSTRMLQSVWIAAGVNANVRSAIVCSRQISLNK